MTHGILAAMSLDKCLPRLLLRRLAACSAPRAARHFHFDAKARLAARRVQQYEVAHAFHLPLVGHLRPGPCATPSTIGNGE